ncbi:MAG TPA: porin, partial [Microvirga sp.]|nr:porin [Microvirga sp.]
KSLLLGTAAGLVTVAGAQAADLPVRKAAAVEYVQLCPAFGRGFWTIPGTDSCLSISGFARGELIVAEQDNAAQDAVGWRARMRLNFDVRTATAVGPVRAYIRLDTNRSYGAGFTAGGLGSGFVGLAGVGGLGGGGATAQGLIVDQAYVQWGGFIAGRNTSIFSPGPGGDRYFGVRFDDGPNNEQFAYVFDAGGGLEIAAAIENPFNRRTNTAAFAGSVVGAGGILTPGLFAFGPNSGALNYGGQELPDFVGRVTYKGTWGYAYVAGAVHQVNDVGVNFQGPAVGGVLPPVVTTRASGGDEIGFAVNGSVEVNLPMISAGSLAWVWAGYADGAVSYVGYGIGGPGGDGGVRGSSFLSGPGGTAIGDLPVADAVVVGGNTRTTEAFSVAAGFRYTFSPQFRSNIYGSYSFVDFAAGASSVITAGAFTGARTGFVDFEEFNIAGNLIYTPVAGLDLGVEVLYRNLDFDANVIRTRPVAGGGFVQDVVGSDDTILGRFRVNRSF